MITEKQICLYCGYLFSEFTAPARHCNFACKNCYNKNYYASYNDTYFITLGQQIIQYYSKINKTYFYKKFNFREAIVINSFCSQIDFEKKYKNFL